MGAVLNIFKNVIKLITGLFSGVLGLVTGIFSKKGEPKAVTASASPAPVQKAKLKKGKDGFFMEADSNVAAPAAVAPVALPTNAVAPVAAGKKVVEAKPAKGKAGKVAAAAAVAVASVATPVMTRPMDATELITMALAATVPTAAQQQQAMTESGPSYAEMNAVPMATAGRRGPGANMSGFMDMAKNVKKGGSGAKKR